MCIRDSICTVNEHRSSWYRTKKAERSEYRNKCAQEEMVKIMQKSMIETTDYVTDGWQKQSDYLLDLLTCRQDRDIPTHSVTYFSSLLYGWFWPVALEIKMLPTGSWASGTRNKNAANRILGNTPLQTPLPSFISCELVSLKAQCSYLNNGWEPCTQQCHKATAHRPLTLFHKVSIWIKAKKLKHTPKKKNNEEKELLAS